MGLWDKNGRRDNYGSLNLLTPENTLEAQQEICSKKGVALNWNQGCVHEPRFAREKPTHIFKDLKPLGLVAYDDLIHINTQSGSQWDGFRHWDHQEIGLYYNGLQHDEISDPDHVEKNGIHSNSPSSHPPISSTIPTTRHEITIQDIEAIAAEQNVTSKPADILLIRSGWVKWYNEAKDDVRVRFARDGHEHVGLAGNRESIEWLWNHHFAAVAGDAIAFEAWPPKALYRCIHDHCLAMWGTLIGELWNLEELAEVCEGEQKYSFSLRSALLNVHGGVASPPNALAIL